jgi:O-methyltransferase
MAETWTMKVQFALHRAVAKLSYGVTHYRHPERANQLAAALEASRGISTATTPLECMEIFQAVTACEKVQGDIAEVGVFRGGTAALMLRASQKRLHLFDTFEGLPHGENQFKQGEFKGSLKDVSLNLSRWTKRIEFHPGMFPQSAERLGHLRFSFVHLDLDLYAGTLSGLEWFWPRLESGGVILSHDYPTSAGVVRAFHEFFDSRPEPFFPLAGCQCLAVKP